MVIYKPGTILALKEPRDPDPVTGEEYPYNRVEVVGESPVGHVGGLQEWDGAMSVGVTIKPAGEFGGTVDRPIGELRHKYKVEYSPPERELEMRHAGQNVKVVVQDAPEGSPEDAFSKSAPATKAKK